MLADNFIVTIRTENFKPNYPRLETNQIILNISDGTSKDGLYQEWEKNKFKEREID